MLWKIWRCAARLFHVEHCALFRRLCRSADKWPESRDISLEGRNRFLSEFGVFLLSLAGSEDLFHVEHKASLRFNLSASNARETEFTQSAPAPFEKSRSISASGARRNQKRKRMSWIRNGYLTRLPSNKNRCSDLGTATGSDQVHNGSVRTSSKSRPPSHSSACLAAI
jgi:hypothetical protein